MRRLRDCLALTLTMTGTAMAAHAAPSDTRHEAPELIVLGGTLIVLSLCQRWLVRR